jgi:hypothetical protein
MQSQHSVVARHFQAVCWISWPNRKMSSGKPFCKGLEHPPEPRHGPRRDRTGGWGQHGEFETWLQTRRDDAENSCLPVLATIYKLYCELIVLPTPNWFTIKRDTFWKK